MSTDNVLDEMQAILKLKEEYEQKVRSFGREKIGAYLQELMKDLDPGIVAIRWRQYAPYFNDGDPCVFRVHDPQFKCSDEILKALEALEIESDSCDGYYDDFDFHYYFSGKHRPATERPAALTDKVIEDQGRLAKAWDRLPKDVLEAAFGDGSEIEVTREGIEINDYTSHD